MSLFNKAAIVDDEERYLAVCVPKYGYLRAPVGVKDPISS